MPACGERNRRFDRIRKLSVVRGRMPLFVLVQILYVVIFYSLIISFQSGTRREEVDGRMPA